MKILILTLFIISFGLDAHSQEPGHRPRVGLVLSGGGAHGIAHLGVLKVMEEAGLRPDYITGVSMGSIIGGMYSLGYSADSIRSILLKINWEVVLSNKIPENKIVFPEKYYFYNSIISLPTSSAKVTLPTGLINCQLIENLLSYYFWPAADISDFSKLPIPFMCVGSDIISFRKVDLKTGYLPEAIRASSAVPSIFTPVKMDTMLLVDGGLIRNFAASEAKEMGAEILIGSYAGFKAYTEEDLQSVSGIIKQIAFSRSLEDFREEKKLVDVLIIHQKRNFHKTKFENIDSLIQRGYEAALPYKKYFRQLADSFNRIEKQKPLENILNKQYYKFDRIDLKGNRVYTDSQIKGVVDIEPGEQVDKTTLNSKIELLYGKAWFEKVKYRIVPRNDSLILEIDCEEKPRGMIYGSVHFDNSLKAGVILGLSVKNLLTKRSSINLNSFIAQYFRFDFSATQFVDRNQKFGFSLNFYSDNTKIPMLDIKGDRGEVVSRNFIPGASINRTIGLNQLMTLSVKYENTLLIPQYLSERHLKILTYNYLTAGYDYQVNSVDTKYFPNRGLILSLSAASSRLLSASVKTDTSEIVSRLKEKADFSPERFYTLCGHLSYYFSPSRSVTLSVGGDALLITGTDSVSAGNSFYLAGGVESLNRRSVPLIGYHSNEIPATRLVAARIALDIEFIKDLHLEMIANLAAIEQPGKSDGPSLFAGYGLGIGYMSIIGPLKLGIMHGNSSTEDYFNNLKGYISIGFKF